jgi:hypothetical protein
VFAVGSSMLLIAAIAAWLIGVSTFAGRPCPFSGTPCNRLSCRSASPAPRFITPPRSPNKASS